MTPISHSFVLTLIQLIILFISMLYHPAQEQVIKTPLSFPPQCFAELFPHINPDLHSHSNCFVNTPPKYDPQQSDSPCNSHPHTQQRSPVGTFIGKEKLELCRKFLQIGTCPYGYRCKFAHGTHELRQNQHANNRYKTKRCGAFLKENYCRFGDRCNFIHKKVITEYEWTRERRKELAAVLRNHREFIHEMRTESRLLKLLEISVEEKREQDGDGQLWLENNGGAK